MDISGSYTLYAPRDRVWAALLDPDVLKRTVPGCERLDKEGEDTYLLRLNVGVASVKGVYDGTLRLTDLHRPDHYRMIVDGKGARGVLHGDGALSLEARDPNATIVSYSGTAQLNGPIAGVGMRVAGGAANMLIKAYFSKLADLLAASAPVASGPASAPAPATADVVPEEVVDSPFQGPPPQPVAATDFDVAPVTSATSAATLETTPAASAVRVSPASSGAPVRSTAAASAAVIVAPPRRGPLMRLVRRAGLSDGSIESERRWARSITGGALVVAAVIVAIVVLAAQSARH